MEKRQRRAGEAAGGWRLSLYVVRSGVALGSPHRRRVSPSRRCSVVDGHVHRLGGPTGLPHDRRAIPAMALLAVLFGSTQPLLLLTR
jgi:hypothetical protein